MFHDRSCSYVSSVETTILLERTTGTPYAYLSHCVGLFKCYNCSSEWASMFERTTDLHHAARTTRACTCLSSSNSRQYHSIHYHSPQGRVSPLFISILSIPSPTYLSFLSWHLCTHGVDLSRDTQLRNNIKNPQILLYKDFPVVGPLAFDRTILHSTSIFHKFPKLILICFGMLLCCVRTEVSQFRSTPCVHVQNPRYQQISSNSQSWRLYI